MTSTEVDRHQSQNENCCKTCGSHCIRKWFRKYFCEGQLKKRENVTANNEHTTRARTVQQFIHHNRRLVAVAIPVLLFHIFWWAAMIRHNLWSYFTDTWFISVTMIFGSMIAGLTSEGGGAVAFPVMTLAFKIAPSIARDFSMMIQSCGMSAASITILIMNIKLEHQVIYVCTLGGAVGVITGLEVVDPLLSPAQKKMAFVSVWSSFALVLFLLNRAHKRVTFEKIPEFNWWKGVVLFFVGFAGGICTSFSGNGLDICTFSFITLLFRVSEKVATPTSVILMAINSLVGFYWREVMMGGVHPDAWIYTIVCIPIVVIGAPIGSFLGSHFHRLVLATLVYILDTVALVSAFVLVKQTLSLIILSISTISIGFIFFFIMSKMGEKLLERQLAKRANNKDKTESENSQSSDKFHDSLLENDQDKETSSEMVLRRE